MISTRRALALAVLACACAEEGEPPSQPKDAAVASLDELLAVDPAGESGVASAEPGAADDTHVGVVIARETVDVAARHPGEVAEVFVRIGDEVEVGDPIARLDEDSVREARSVIRAELGAAQAELAQARVNVREARNRLERRRELEDTVAREDIEAAGYELSRAQAAHSRARADVNRQRAQLREIDRQLGETNIVAPLPGTVSTRYVDPGALVDPGAPIVRLLASEGTWIRFALPPAVAASLEPEAEVEAVIEAAADPARAVVRQIAPQIDPESRLVLVEAELLIPADEKAQIYAGLPVRVRVDREDAGGQAP